MGMNPALSTEMGGRCGIQGNVCMLTRHLPPRGVGCKQVMLAKNDNGFYTLYSREKYLRFTHELNPFELISKQSFFIIFFRKSSKIEDFWHLLPKCVYLEMGAGSRFQRQNSHKDQNLSFPGIFFVFREPGCNPKCSKSELCIDRKSTFSEKFFEVFISILSKFGISIYYRS